MTTVTEIEVRTSMIYAAAMRAAMVLLHRPLHLSASCSLATKFLIRPLAHVLGVQVCGNKAGVAELQGWLSAWQEASAAASTKALQQEASRLAR